ncbi:MAG: tetratricopeptide repeat protein [Candidatus Kapabacteria bacterium]|nr:tetratricopeptide repeat protein [Ignavibacteriota bacterium]MCW5884376.1 tetratricopeptide repeat protein [Candidatus Kapabacteria bacterium]
MKDIKKIVIILILSVLPIYSQVVELPIDYGTRAISLSESLYDIELLHLAEQKLVNDIKKFPMNVSYDKSVLLQSDIDLQSGNFNIADGKLYEFIKSRSNSPYVPFAALKRGYMKYELGDYKQAEILFEEAELLASRDYEYRGQKSYDDIVHRAMFWRSMSLSHQGRHLDALPLFKETVSKYPESEYSDDSYYYIGRIHEINRNHDSALFYYRYVTKNYQYGSVYLVSLIREANNNLMLRQPSSALIALERAETLSSHFQNQDSVSKLYEKQMFAENAIEKIKYMKGEAYNIGGNHKEAVKVFESYIDEFPNSQWINYARLSYGWALLNLGDHERALEQYSIIIDNTNDENLHARSIAQLYRVVALKRKGDEDTARRELAGLALQASYPYQGLVLMELGQIHYEAGEYEQAVKTLERAERESQDGRTATRVHLLLGASYIELKLWEKAVIQYRKAENLATASNEILMPNRKWYISESKLKEGIALVQSHRAGEAIGALQNFIGNNKGDARNEEALFWLAESYYRVELLKNASDTYNRLLETYPRTSRREEALYGLGWSYFRVKDFSNSSKIFDKLIADFPKTKYAVEVLTRQADGYYMEKRFHNASNSYKRAAALSPGTEEGQYASYQLSHALYRNGNYEQAITSLLDFVRVYNKSPYAPNALYLIGWIRFQQRKYAESIDNFEFLINAYPQSSLTPRAYYAIGDAYYNLGRYEEAISSYKIVIESYPGNEMAPEAIKSIQFCLIALGRESEAIDIASQYVETNPESPFAPVFQKKIGEMFYQGRKYRDAIAEYEKFIQKNPNDENIPEVLYWMAKSYVSLNETDQASIVFERITRDYPTSDYAPLSMLDNGLLQIEVANIAAADRILKSLQEKYPEDNNAAQAGFERGVLKYKLGDTLSALDIFLNVTNRYPSTDWGDQSRYRIAMHYRASGANDSARVHFSFISAIADNPSISSESQYRIGELWMRDKNYEQATTAFIVVKENYEGYEDWYSLSLLSLGEAYENLDKFDEAREIYSALEALRPDDDFGNTAKSRIKRIKNK